MSKLDKKNDELLKKVSAKLATLDAGRPEQKYETSCLFRNSEGKEVNLRTIQSLDYLLDLLALQLQHYYFREKAAESIGARHFDTHKELIIQDFKTRAAQIAWLEERDRLELLESRLKHAMSDDLKQKLELEDIESQLGE